MSVLMELHGQFLNGCLSLSVHIYTQTHVSFYLSILCKYTCVYMCTYFIDSVSLDISNTRTSKRKYMIVFASYEVLKLLLLTYLRTFQIIHLFLLGLKKNPVPYSVCDPEA